MEEVRERRGESLLDAKISRRRALAAGAWSVPVAAAAVAVPMAAASGTLNPLADLKVLALGGAEGRYSTGGNYASGPVSANQDFRRGFSIQNTGQASFTGSLTITFTFPRMWNQATGNNADAFSNYGTVDLGGTGGASIGSASAWVTSAATAYTQNTGTSAWTNVWLRMDDASVTLMNVVLPAGGTVRFALNAGVPQAWIGTSGQYLPGRIYWRSDIYVTATTANGTALGTYGPVPDPDTSSNWANGIWYWNGGGPYAYDGGMGLYPAYGTA